VALVCAAPAKYGAVHRDWKWCTRNTGASGNVMSRWRSPHSIYPLTEGVTQDRVRASVNRALAKLAANPGRDLLPASVVSRLHLPPLREALEFSITPPVGTSLAVLAAGQNPAQRRLSFEECWRTSYRCSSSNSAHRVNRLRHCMTRPLSARFVASLPFTLTAAQARTGGRERPATNCR
jgi:ATP-dependent DNA helicase RecG